MGRVLQSCKSLEACEHHQAKEDAHLRGMHCPETLVRTRVAMAQEGRPEPYRQLPEQMSAPHLWDQASLPLAHKQRIGFGNRWQCAAVEGFATTTANNVWARGKERRRQLAKTCHFQERKRAAISLARGAQERRPKMPVDKHGPQRSCARSRVHGQS